MRFNDVTLDGLMKEFEQISKASEKAEQGYVLPQDLLDQPAAIVDVPYYDEILKRTASERAGLYGAMADSKILDEAHPKGSTKLEGLSGEETTVEDLQEMKKRFEDVVNSTVKVKKAALFKKLEKLASQLEAAGHTQSIDALKGQINKLADVTFGDEDAVVTEVPKTAPKYNAVGMSHVSNIIDMFEQPLMDIMGADGAYKGTIRSWNGLDQDLRKYFMLYPSNVKNLPAGAQTYSNWDQLAQLVKSGLEEYKNLRMGDEPSAPQNGDVANIDVQQMRNDLQPTHEIDTGHKGPPEPPLSLHGPR